DSSSARAKILIFANGQSARAGNTRTMKRGLPRLVGGGAHDVSSRTLLARKYFEVEMIFRRHDRARDEVGEGAGQCHRVVEVDPVDPRVRLVGELQLDNAASTIGNRATSQVPHMSYRLDARCGCLAN